MMLSSMRKLFGTSGLAAASLVGVGATLVLVGALTKSAPVLGIGLFASIFFFALFVMFALRTQAYAQNTLKSNLTKRLAAVESVSREVSADVEATKDYSSDILDTVRGVGPKFGNFTDPKSGYRGVGIDYNLASRSFRAAPPMGSFALSSGSIAFRDVLALAGTGMQFRAEDLFELVRCWNGGLVETRELIKMKSHLHARGLLDLATVVQHQQREPLDQENAVALFRLALRLWGVNAFTKQQRFLALEAETAIPHTKSALRIAKEYGLPRERQQIRLLAANEALGDLRPESPVHSEQARAWVDRVNEVFAAGGYAPVQFDGVGFEAKNLLDNLVPVALEEADHDFPTHGPLVSVIMPTFRPGEELWTAVRSVLDQTYRDIELLVVDDGSGEEFETILAEIDDLDDRVTVIRQAANQGAYPTRNAGLKRSSGDFITVHDDDDWSHPQKIAAQVGHLLDNSEVPANMSAHVRLTDSGQLVRINVNAILIQPNYSSLMFRREVTDRVGGWQEVRKGADSEFKERIDSVYDTRVPVLLQAPLSFTRTSTGNLTFGDISRGFISSDRRWFANLHRITHENIARGDLPLEKAAEVHPATPLSIAGKLDSTTQFDVVYCTDFRFPGGTTALAVAELELLMKNGYKVALVQMDSPVNGHATPIAPRVVEFVARNPLCSVVSLRDEIQAKMVIVRQPGLLEYADGLVSGIRAQIGAIIANTTPVFPDGENVAFNLVRCRTNFLSLFGVEGRVYPESPVTRELLEALGYARMLEPANWPGMAPDKFQPAARNALEGRRPVVGRHSRDHRDKWPEELSVLEQTYFNPAAYDTKILGGIDEIPYKVPPALLASTQVYGFGEIEPEKFLEEIDFFIHFPSSGSKESFGMATVEALASGRVAILPPYMEPVFGDAAVYAEPEDLTKVVEEYWDNAQAYDEQSARGRQFVDENFRGAHLLEMMSSFESGA